MISSGSTQMACHFEPYADFDALAALRNMSYVGERQERIMEMMNPFHFDKPTKKGAGGGPIYMRIELLDRAKVVLARKIEVDAEQITTYNRIIKLLVDLSVIKKEAAKLVYLEEAEGELLMLAKAKRGQDVPLLVLSFS